MQLALELWHDQTDGLCRAGAGRHDVHRGGPRPAKIFVHQVQNALVVGVRMDGRHETVLDAEAVVQHFSDRRQQFVVHEALKTIWCLRGL